MDIVKHLTSQTLRLREKTEKRMDLYTRPSKNFFILISLSSAIVVLGLMLNNTAVIIGGMVVAPLITPIFGLSLGVILLKTKTIGRALISIILGSLAAIIISAVISYLTISLEGSHLALTAEITNRTNPNILFFLVALFSGMAGAYAYTHEKAAERVTGIAISVALIPPLSVMGIGLSVLNLVLVQQSALLYVFNLFGICFGSIIMFVLMGFGKNIDAT